MKIFCILLVLLGSGKLGSMNIKFRISLFFLKIFIYLFWLHWVLVVAHGIFVAVCGIFSYGMRTS